MVWDFFASLKLTIITLILLAVTSIIGTVIQQNKAPQEYIQVYGEKTYQIFEALQFTDMYHSWWFLLLLEIFSLNLVTCSAKRFPRVWKLATAKMIPADEGQWKTLSSVREYRAKIDAEEASRRVAASLKSRFGEPEVIKKDGATHLLVQKGAWSRFGVYVTHLSILVIFIGAIIGNLWGFKAYVNIEEGTSTDRVWIPGQNQPLALGFSVRCDDFDVTYYEGSNRPKEFMSILDVIDGGQEVISDRKIIVNDPVSYKGITFYQSSYGQAGQPTVRMKVKVRETGEVLDLTARQGQHVRLPGGYAFAVSQVVPNYSSFGPAAQMHVNTPDGRHGNPFMVMQRFPNFDANRNGKFIFSLVDFEQKQYTGLQVKKDPGVWVVWLGCLLMVVGSIVAFMLSHRRLWAEVVTDGKGCRVRIGGSAHRNQPGFALFFDDLADQLDSDLKN